MFNKNIPTSVVVLLYYIFAVDCKISSATTIVLKQGDSIQVGNMSGTMIEANEHTAQNHENTKVYGMMIITF